MERSFWKWKQNQAIFNNLDADSNVTKESDPYSTKQLSSKISTDAMNHNLIEMSPMKAVHNKKSTSGPRFQLLQE
jgi:hypothetical protein